MASVWASMHKIDLVEKDRALQCRDLSVLLDFRLSSRSEVISLNDLAKKAGKSLFHMK